MQIRIDSDNSVIVSAQSKHQKRSAAYIVNEVLKGARKAGILKMPKAAKKS